VHGRCGHGIWGAEGILEWDRAGRKGKESERKWFVKCEMATNNGLCVCEVVLF